MNEYIIKKVIKSEYQYLVFGTSVESPLYLLKQIAKELKDSECTVLFDQLLQTGDSDNRFLTITFTEHAFDLKTAKNIDGKIVDENTRKIVADFLRSNEKILEYCILFSGEKELIKTGGTI